MVIWSQGSLKSKRVHQFTAQLKERNADGKYYSLCEIHSSLSDKKVGIFLLYLFETEIPERDELTRGF